MLQDTVMELLRSKWNLNKNATMHYDDLLTGARDRDPELGDAEFNNAIKSLKERGSIHDQGADGDRYITLKASLPSGKALQPCRELRPDVSAFDQALRCRSWTTWS